MICPFFGDQNFWGEMVVRAGVGVAPIPIHLLTSDNLAAAFAKLTAPELTLAAQAMQRRILAENGVKGAAEAFRKHLPVQVREPRPIRLTPLSPGACLFVLCVAAPAHCGGCVLSGQNMVCDVSLFLDETMVARCVGRRPLSRTQTQSVSRLGPSAPDPPPLACALVPYNGCRKWCDQCEMKMSVEVDRVVHRGKRARHHRHDYR